MHEQCFCSLRHWNIGWDWQKLVVSLNGRIAWRLPRDHTSEDVQPYRQIEIDRESPLSEAIPEELFFPQPHDKGYRLV